MISEETKNVLNDLVIDIYINIRDLEEKLAFAEASEKDYIQGRIWSYKEVLEIIKHYQQKH